MHQIFPSHHYQKGIYFFLSKTLILENDSTLILILFRLLFSVGELKGEDSPLTMEPSSSCRYRYLIEFTII